MVITTNWFQETHKGQRSFGLSIKEVLYHKRSEYQDILIFDNDEFGRVMVLDDCYMLSDLDEHMYHMALTRYGMQNIDSVKNNLNILVIGAGDGGIVRDLLRNWGERINRVTMVEIDRDVIEVSKRFFPQIAAEFDNPKLDLQVADALSFIDNVADGSFDLVLCDSTDPVGFAAGLIETDFYKKIKRILTSDGVFCAQSGSPIFMQEELMKAQCNLQEVFVDQQIYYAPMLVYPGVLWSYVAAGNKILDRNNIDLKEFICPKSL